MRYFLLFLLAGVSIPGISQTLTTYTTFQSGQYGTNSTWVGNAKPPTSGTCNCKIVVASGTTLTISTTVNINNANFSLPGANSAINMSGNTQLTLGGTSSIDLRSTSSTITLTHPQNKITLGGQVIFQTSTSSVNQSGTGVVRGLASASTSNPTPFFTNSVLPVKLREFKVIGKENKAILSWITDAEVNSDHFEIERSTDGKIWSNLASINAAGNSNVTQSYLYTDNSPVNGNNYYRLKIVDIDAKYEYSPVKSASINATAFTLSATPNPASSTLYISVMQTSNKDYQLRLINRSGQVVYNKRQSASAGRISLPVSEFMDGTYFLEATEASGSRVVKSIVIAKRQ